jgi:thiol-disulfide isomerase/thioredoxin
MRFCLSVFVLFSGSVSVGDDAKSTAPPRRDERIGKAPPPLRASRWLQGNPVEEFEAGKIYVVEFWATWCGPCVAIMPHLGELQRKYRDPGVVIIGFTATDSSNTVDKVDAFVARRGKKLGYTIALAENNDTWNSYLHGSPSRGIPSAYVINRDGKLAYIGHPAFLDDVLPQVIAGTWDPVDGMKALDKADEEFDRVYAALRGPDFDSALKMFEAYEAKYPALAHGCYFWVPRLTALINAKRPSDALVFARQLLAQAVEQEDDYLLKGLARALRSPEARNESALVSLAVGAAEASLRFAGDSDLGALLAAAESCAIAGDRARGVEYGKKAVAVAKTAAEANKDKDDLQPLVRLAQAHLAAGDTEQARAVEKKALDAAKGDGVRNMIRQMIEQFDPGARREK